MADLAMSDGINWVFRIALIIAVIWAIIGFRMLRPQKAGFLQFFSVGMVTTGFLGFYIAVSSFILFNFIDPNYLPRFEAFYKEKREVQMYYSQLQKKQEDLDDTTYRLNSADSLIVKNGLEKHMEGTHFFFTKTGQILINFIFSLVWGIAITLSVTLMMPKKGQ